MKIKPPVAFFMCLTLYIAFFLVISCIVTFQSAMESAVLTQTNIPYQYKDAVIIDPGHGGLDGGTVGISGTTEKELNLQVAEKLRHVMQLFGVPADMTRESDQMLGEGGDTIAQKKVSDMQTRLAMINAKPYRLMMSIHMNHYPEEKYWGSQVFYAKKSEEAKAYGKAIQTSFRQFASPDNKREAKQASDEIYLLKHADCPALIIECGFLSNSREEKLLQSDTHQIKLAAAIAAGYLSARPQLSSDP